MKLKALPDTGVFDRSQCAAFRCPLESSVVDSSLRLWDVDVPLCDYHWTERCEVEVPDANDCEPAESPAEALAEEVRVRVPRKALRLLEQPAQRPAGLPGLRAIQARMARRLAEQTK